MARNEYRLYGCMGKRLRSLETILGALQGKSVDVWGIGNMQTAHICSSVRKQKKNPELASRILLWGSLVCYSVSGCVKSGLPTFADSSDVRFVWYSFNSSLLLGTRSNSATNSPKIRRVAGWFFASVPSP